MENLTDTLKMINDEALEDVAGGRDVINKDTQGHKNAKKLIDIGPSSSGSQKINYLDAKGVCHIVCSKCGDEINSFTPVPGSSYAVGPQICKNCMATGKNIPKRRNIGAKK